LLLITAWNEAWKGRAAGGRGSAPSEPDARGLPFGLPDGVTRFHLVIPTRLTISVIRLQQAFAGADEATRNPFPI
jgi:hypothetical protein